MATELSGSKGYVSELPFEILAMICELLDLRSLGRLRRASKAWKEIIDSDTLMRKICVREDIIQDVSQSLQDLTSPSRFLPAASDEQRSDGHIRSSLQAQGYTANDLSSWWSLLGAKTLRRKGLPFRSEFEESAPTGRKAYLCSVPWSTDGHSGVHKVSVDWIDRVLITTHRGKGLKVHCLDSGKLLWQDETVPGSSLLEHSQGFVCTTEAADPAASIQIWSFDRLSPHGGSSRGSLSKLGIVKSPEAVVTSRFSFPFLAVLNRDLHACVFDVREPASMLQNIDVEPKQASRSGWWPTSIDFDDDFLFILLEPGNTRDVTDLEVGPFCLQVFSRQTGELIWTLNTRSQDAVPHRYTYHFEPDPFQPRWDHPYVFPGGSSVWGPYFQPTGIRHDPHTGSLCLFWATNLAIFPSYQTMLREGYKPPYKPYILQFSSDGGDEDPQPVRSFDLGPGMACFNLDEGKVLVDLRKVLADDVEESVARFVPSQIEGHWAAEEFMLDCSSIYLDESVLAFQSIDGRRVETRRLVATSCKYNYCGSDCDSDCEGDHSDFNSDCSHSDCVESVDDYDREGDEQQSTVTLFEWADLGLLSSDSDKKHSVKTLPLQEKDNVEAEVEVEGIDDA